MTVETSSKSRSCRRVSGASPMSSVAAALGTSGSSVMDRIIASPDPLIVTGSGPDGSRTLRPDRPGYASHRSARGRPGGGGSRHGGGVGGGFAGMAAAKHVVKDPRLTVTLIDQHNYHQFQPLLYQVATSQLAETD